MFFDKNKKMKMKIVFIYFVLFFNFQINAFIQYPSFGVGMPNQNYGGYYDNRPNSAQTAPQVNTKKYTSNKKLDYKKMNKNSKDEDDCSIF